MLRILNVVGARPNFMKIAPLMAEYKNYPQIQPLLVHTGQHYDAKMSQLFFEQLEIPRPDIHLEVGSGSHAVQTAEIMKRFEPILMEFKPDIMLVVGDVNSTIACALVAVKLGIKVAHVEAGLRSFDREMPEEINRILTDAISDYLFVTEPSGVKNLTNENVSPNKIFLVGNVMIDTLLRNVKKADASPILETLGLQSRGFVLLTLHRPSNVDDPHVLGRLMDVLKTIGQTTPIVFPVHPRTLKNLHAFRFIDDTQYAVRAEKNGLCIIEPLGYLDFLKLIAMAKIVLTDSGGIQEETTILGVPCLTLRENTERPITVERGTNRLVGSDPERILHEFNNVFTGGTLTHEIPDLWDGQSAGRIVKVLLDNSI
jgi:UDP-N-acetylglucosamine 2-epimerase (non-hydrolysing)